MSREKRILREIGKAAKGLEIAPYHAPLAAKRDGYNCRILDVFDTGQLRRNAEADPLIPERSRALIEDVDYVGSATDLENLIPADEHGTFDYVLSSHNFEHLANPISFLRGVEVLLKPGGRLTMAVPDARACFDYYRPNTMLGDWLDAYVKGRHRPSQRQLFEFRSYMSVREKNGSCEYAFHPGVPASKVRVEGDIAVAFGKWQASRPGGAYEDAHCTVMTPASLRLLIEESRLLGLTGLEVEEITGTTGCEFVVRLVKPSAPSTSHPSADDIKRLRTDLLREATRQRHTGYLAMRIASKLVKWRNSLEKRLPFR